jgi:hypothetical protein
LIFGLGLAWVVFGDGRTLGNNPCRKWIEGYLRYISCRTQLSARQKKPIKWQSYSECPFLVFRTLITD